MGKLTNKQRRFVEEYLVDLNAVQASIRAGYAETSRSAGYKNLSNPQIAAEIEKAMAERSRRTGINQDRVLRELAKLAFVNASDLIDPENGALRPGAAEDDLACIQSVKVKSSDSEKGSSNQREVKLADKLKALELLGKHLGLFNEKLSVEMTVPVFGGEDDLED